MITDLYSTQTVLPRNEFSQWADRWANLGIWCTLWNRNGQLISPLPQTSIFWKTFWNHGQGLRNEIARTVRQCLNEAVTDTLLDVAGLCVHCFPLDSPASPSCVLAACYIDGQCRWGEDFSRLCSKWQLDERTVRVWGRRHQQITKGQANDFLFLVCQSVRSLSQVIHQQSTVDEMTVQLSDAYEELSLIYRLWATMRVTQRPRGHFERLFEDLAKTTPITTLAAVLFDSEILDPEDRLIIGGEPIVDPPGVLKIVDSLSTVPQQSGNALIINEVKEYPQLAWAQGWLEQLIAVPIVCNQTSLGMVLLLNQRGNRDFTSSDARFMQAVVDRSAVYLENVLLYGDLNKLLMGLLHALVSSIDAKDPYTCGHSNRVALVSKRIAEASGAGADQAERVYLSGLLHDVGKLGISETILCKPGELSTDQMATMRKHPEIGARILSGVKQLDDIIPGVLYHHERLDGTGYPEGLAVEEIPWVAKIVGLADAFDAMTSARTYRQALSPQETMEEIHRSAGTQFCRELVESLAALVEEGLAREVENNQAAISFDNVPPSWSKGERRL